MPGDVEVVLAVNGVIPHRLEAAADRDLRETALDQRARGGAGASDEVSNGKRHAGVEFQTS